MTALPQERVEASTLFLTGGKSHYVLPEDVNTIKQWVPQATFEVMAGAGHWLHAEDPAQFIERTLAYLS
jgi:pimeloyl-ACP methyl ester carboxylesterase